MARSRNVKPGFFFNTDLADIEPLGRLLFIGLWTIADRDGRLVDEVRWIKAQTLPYDECDVDALLNKLAEKNFLIRYEVKGNRYMQILNFAKHQNPHRDEKSKEIPAYKGYKSTKPARCKNGTSIDKAPKEHGSGRDDSLLLNADSFNLIIDSFHRECPSLPSVMRLTERRKKTLRARLKEYPPERLTEAFKKVAASSFLTGDNDRGWRADFDWILNENNLVKILEGKYDDKKEAQVHGRAGTSTEFDTEFAGIYE